MIDAKWVAYKYEFDAVWIKGMTFPDSCKECCLKMNCDACEGLEVYCTPLSKCIGYEDDILADRGDDGDYIYGGEKGSDPYILIKRVNETTKPKDYFKKYQESLKQQY